LSVCCEHFTNFSKRRASGFFGVVKSTITIQLLQNVSFGAGPAPSIDGIMSRLYQFWTEDETILVGCGVFFNETRPANQSFILHCPPICYYNEIRFIVFGVTGDFKLLQVTFYHVSRGAPNFPSPPSRLESHLLRETIN